MLSKEALPLEDMLFHNDNDLLKNLILEVFYYRNFLHLYELKNKFLKKKKFFSFFFMVFWAFLFFEIILFYPS